MFAEGYDDTHKTLKIGTPKLNVDITRAQSSIMFPPAPDSYTTGLMTVKNANHMMNEPKIGQPYETTKRVKQNVIPSVFMTRNIPFKPYSQTG